MGYRAGRECLPDVESAAWRYCEQLDDNDQLNWQWCGPSLPQYNGTRVVQWSEVASTVTLRMHCDGSYTGCGSTQMATNSGRNIVFPVKSCEEFADVARMQPALAQFDVGLALVLGAAAIYRLFQGSGSNV
jgi:hypothetical protein